MPLKKKVIDQSMVIKPGEKWDVQSFVNKWWKKIQLPGKHSSSSSGTLLGMNHSKRSKKESVLREADMLCSAF
jgi:hypothetical protein